jgi:hypothetical protein
MIVAAPTLLSNLSFDVVETSSWHDMAERSTTKASFGWPLIWYWLVVVDSKVLGPARGWDYNATRLAGNVVIWLMMFVVVGLAWEWLLRRYRPRLRFSLRTMLVAVGLLAAVSAWAAAVRSRAHEQDALTSLASDDVVFVERWGPKWLDLVGADCYRRRVVGALLVSKQHEEDEELLKRLARLPGLRFFSIDGHRWTSGTAAALGDVRQVRTMWINFYWHEKVAHECLTWVGKLTQLERLYLMGAWKEAHVRGDHLARLAGLTNLKSLKLSIACDQEATHECLAAIGKLTQLERLCLEGAWEFHSHDLTYLSGLTNLKSLTIEKVHTQDEEVAHECLAAVGKLTQLERLCLEGFEFRSHDLALLGDLTSLKSLMLPYVGFADEVSEMRESDGGSRALAHLPVLPRLEIVDLSHAKVGDQELRWLAVLPRLNSLNLSGTSISDAGLAELASLESLEELGIDLRMARAPGLEPLIALKRLREVYIADLAFKLAWSQLGDGQDSGVLPGGLDALHRGLQALRQSHPGIVIDDNDHAFSEKGEIEPPWCPDWNGDERVDRSDFHSFVLECIKER